MRQALTLFCMLWLFASDARKSIGSQMVSPKGTQQQLSSSGPRPGVGVWQNLSLGTFGFLVSPTRQATGVGEVCVKLIILACV
ncbi:hypothetical protein BKA59DRAFT_488439, partial [Fusarium tricinctum]